MRSNVLLTKSTFGTRTTVEGAVARDGLRMGLILIDARSRIP